MVEGKWLVEVILLLIIAVQKKENFSRSFMSGQLPEQNSYFTPRVERPPYRHSNHSVSSRVGGIHYRDIERVSSYEVSSCDNRSVHRNRSRSRQDVPSNNHSIRSCRSRSRQDLPSYVMSPRVREIEHLTEQQYDGEVLSDDGIGANEERSLPLL